MTYLSVSESKSGVAPSPMTTAVRTFWGELQHKVGRLAIDVLGSGSLELGTWSEYWLTQFSAGHRGGHQGHPEEHHRRTSARAPAMKFVLTPEQLDVGAVAAKFLSDRLPLPQGARARRAGRSRARPRWPSTRAPGPRCAELGWFGLGVPASLGGVGYGPVEEIMLFTELGRHLAPGPFASTAVAGWLAAAAGERELADEHLRGPPPGGPRRGRLHRGRRAWRPRRAP